MTERGCGLPGCVRPLPRDGEVPRVYVSLSGSGAEHTGGEPIKVCRRCRDALTEEILSRKE